MKYLFLLCIFALFYNCNLSEKQTFTKVSITPLLTDSLSVRAIAPVDENKVWFAANKGIVGLMDGTTPKISTLAYNDSILHFRSIAKTDSGVFVLSIANPAVLYKIKYNDTIATGLEEVYVESNKNVFYDAMAFFDAKVGIAMGDPTDTCLSIIKTTDYGSTWTKIPCSQLPKTFAGEAAFAASNSNIAIVNDNVWIVTGGKRARVFYSPDRGVSWEVFNTPIIQGKEMTGIYSVDFYDENLGVIFGGDWEDKSFNEGNKAITNDGGKTWQLLSNGKGPGYGSSVRFVPGSKGKQLVAVGSPLGIVYSSDQGKNWVTLSEVPFYAIEFVNETTGYASGANTISKVVFKK